MFDRIIDLRHAYRWDYIIAWAGAILFGLTLWAIMGAIGWAVTR
jgi:hypothetical protein